MSLLQLPRDGVHVYLADPLALGGAERIARYEAQLQPDELHQYRRFRFDEHRHEYLVTRALVRAVLSRYVQRAPRDWRFLRSAQGRPELPPTEPAASWLVFNLSNTSGLVACAVAHEREVGVDVECTDRDGETVGVADRYFAESELRELRARPAERQRDRFFDYWTLKEAYLKARGKGLSLPLDAFSMHLEVAPIRMEVRPPISDDAPSWQLQLWSPTERHRLAVAVRRGEGPELAVDIRWLEP